MNLKKWIPRVTWKEQPQEFKDLQESYNEALGLLSELNNINRGLNGAVGDLMTKIDNLRQEAITLLSAITFQHGGELVVKQEFFDALTSDDNNLGLKIERQEDKTVILRLESIATTEEDKEEEQPTNEQ